GELLHEALGTYPVFTLRVDRAREVPFAFARYLRRCRPDAVLVAMWPLTVLAPVGRLLSRHRCKIVVSEHNPLSLQYGSWGLVHNIALRGSTAMGYRLSDARVGVSFGVVEDIAKLSRLPRRKFEVIHNPLA